MSVNIHINSPNVKYTDTHIEALYAYQTTSVHRNGEKVTVSQTSLLCVCCMCVQSGLTLHCMGVQVTPCTTEMTFRTERRVPRLGVMLVGWGGNNGTTVTAAVLANKLGLTWKTKTGEKVSGERLGCLYVTFITTKQWAQNVTSLSNFQVCCRYQLHTAVFTSGSSVRYCNVS